MGILSVRHVFECAECGVVSPSYVRRSDMERVARAHACAETCPACGYRRGLYGHRGLCGTCYRDHDIRVDYETKTWRANDMLDTWDELLREGHSIRQAAERMGVTFAALEKAIERGSQRGDPRARRRLQRLAGAS